ncbi:MAG TPA: hypothetical protein VNN62_16220 [Methylomirabilota bacterium]|nr:hypothetical protein [Methylomirabilota bacterium]
MRTVAIATLVAALAASPAANVSAQTIQVFGGGHSVGRFGGSPGMMSRGLSPAFRGGFTMSQAHRWHGGPGLFHRRFDHGWQWRHGWCPHFPGLRGNYYYYNQPYYSQPYIIPPFVQPYHGFSYYSFGAPYYSYRSFGYSGPGFAYDWYGNLAGPPPLGAPGPTPFVPSGPPPVVIREPFFCYPHGLGFNDQAVFFAHLAQFHRISSRNPLAYCRFVGGSRWIYFGF